MFNAQRFNLDQKLPVDWYLMGLSAPASDGANLYRKPTAPRIVLMFETEASQFVQYNANLFTPAGVKGGSARFMLNGHPLSTFSLHSGHYQSQAVSGFSRVGTNHLVIDFRCEATCPLSTMRQYQTELILARPQTPSFPVGLGVERWWLDAPGSKLSSTGLGPILFDNANFVRYPVGNTFVLKWPPNTRILDLALRLNADQPFDAVFRVGADVVGKFHGNPSSPVVPTLSLTRFSRARSLEVQLDCAHSTSTVCARVYFTRVSVIPPKLAASPSPEQWLLGSFTLLLAIFLIWVLLGLNVSDVRSGQAGKYQK